MNVETNILRDPIDEEDAAASRRRRNIIIAVIAALAILIGAYVVKHRSAAKTDAAAGGSAAGGGDGQKQSPVVTVTVPGKVVVPGIVSANGTLAARREMPVGVAGEGGMVSRVLVEPGQWVGAGQVLATIDRQVQTQQANALAAQISVAQANAQLTQGELDRAMALVSRGFISKADVQRKVAARDQAAAQVRVAQAQLAQSRASNARLDIRAPAGGLVLTRAVEPGQIVSAGSGALFRLAKGGEMELKALVGEADLARMSVGLSAKVTPVGSTQTFNGQIWQLSPVIDPQTRQGTARIALSYDKALRPGGFAQADISSGTVVAPLLPESAVQSDADGNFVLIVGAGNKVERRNVKTGRVTDKGLPIIEGLNGTEQVVLSAGAFLNPGETVIPTRQTAK